MSRIILKTETSIKDVSQQIWDSFVNPSTISIQYEHLKAIEESNINEHTPYYVLIFDEATLQYVGIAYYFVMDMDLSKVSKEIKPEIIKTVKQWYPNFLKLKMLECGMLAGIGQSFSIKEEYEQEVMPLLVKHIDQQAIDNDIDFILYRDIDSYYYNKYINVFKENNYGIFKGYPSAILRSNWTDLNDYMTSLRSKKRIGVNLVLEKIYKPEISIEKLDDIGASAKELARLWNCVHEKSDTYTHEVLTENYFKSLGKNYSHVADVHVIKRYDEIICFALCFKGDTEYMLAFVGFDSNFNKEYDLYFNMYYICMQEAFKTACKVINMGTTTYDVKLKMGCELKDNAYFIKSIKDDRATATITKQFADVIEVKYNDHRVFNADAKILRDNSKIEFPVELDNDVFNKAGKFHKSNQLRLMDCYTFFPDFESAQREIICYKGRQLVMLGSNSYLGLANDMRVKRAAIDAIEKYGTGCSGSPLMNGTLDLHKQLCENFTHFLKKEDCIIYSTGYQANLGAIGALASSSDLIILDEYSHASLIDGAIFSKAKIARYRHNDLEYLEKLLIRFADVNKMVIADSVFSMEGTVVDLPNLVKICKKHNARLVLDEAHAIGVYGKNGAGVAEHFNLSDQIDVITGTFSKSCASVGGFVAANKTVIDYLRHLSRSHVFSATLPPSCVATVIKALEIIKSEPERREKLISNARYMAEGLQYLGYEVEYHNTAIVPIMCKDELITLSLFKKLFEMGVYVNPVLHPAVPKGGELLRTSYLSTHTTAQLDMVLDVFKKLKTSEFPRVASKIFEVRVA